MENRKNLSRRRFIQLSLCGAASLPLSGVPTRSAWAADPVPLTEDDPLAKKLAYRIDASSVDPSEFPNYQAGQTCANCLHYKGAEDADAGLCALFPGKTVEAKGWCKVWVKT